MFIEHFGDNRSGRGLACHLQCNPFHTMSVPDPNLPFNPKQFPHNFPPPCNVICFGHTFKHVHSVNGGNWPLAVLPILWKWEVSIILRRPATTASSLHEYFVGYFAMSQSVSRDHPVGRDIFYRRVAVFSGIIKNIVLSTRSISSSAIFNMGMSGICFYNQRNV